MLSAGVIHYRRHAPRNVWLNVVTRGRFYVKPDWENNLTEIIPQTAKQFIARDGHRLALQYEGETNVTGIKLNGQEVFMKVK
ncbi:hypothetical protein [Spirosoma jeollabukense]